ncbi:MAG: hypothetical protein A2V64_08840 [Bacteroidetes bacterium RBG_13_43_22]|nr:MAG: hypothetical protein A2V64_08840 [Bacteroidetes bacterium RBG_13_43_22]
MKHLTALILVLILISLPGCKYFKGKKLFGKKARETELLKAKQDSIRVADSIMKVQKRLKAVEDARLDSLRLAEEKRAWDLQHKYNIIVGSFITPEYARSHAETYRQNGYDARIIKMEGGRFDLVSAEAYESFRKAVARLQQFQDTVETEAWLYIMK